jgi:hypothetical protein
VQKRFGSLINISASASFCRARTCGGIGGATGASSFFFRSSSQVAMPPAISATTASTIHNHNHSFGISTGGLMPRISFVATADWSWAARFVFIAPPLAGK